jgi:division protein CdvB (Snf7/Vps24/ESCRT-III family)
MFRYRESWREKFGKILHPEPVKRKLNTTIHRLQVQMRKLESKTYQLQARDKALYAKCVAAVQEKNNAKASMFAEEDSEIRKMVLTTIRSQMLLERVNLRLERVRDFGEFAYSMSSVGAVLGMVRNDLRNIMPEISTEIADVNEILEEMTLEVGQVTEQHFDQTVPTEESEAIMKEATTLAEQRMREKFPEMPRIPTREPGTSLQD